MYYSYKNLKLSLRITKSTPCRIFSVIQVIRLIYCCLKILRNHVQCVKAFIISGNRKGVSGAKHLEIFQVKLWSQTNYNCNRRLRKYAFHLNLINWTIPFATFVSLECHPALCRMLKMSPSIILCVAHTTGFKNPNQCWKRDKPHT